MKVIITGAGGLLGYRLAAAATRAGYTTVCLGRTVQPPTGLACNHWINLDLTNHQLLTRDWTACRGAPVFHLAADTRIYAAGRDFIRDNTDTTAVACQLAQLTGGRMIFFSSAAVYSGPRTLRPITPLQESDETTPISLYGRSKMAAEQLIAGSGVDAVVLRLFGVLCALLPHLPDRGNLVQAITRAWQTGNEMVVATDASGAPTVRDYVMEEDVCQCALAALAWPRSGAGLTTVNLCTGEGTDTMTMVEMARSCLGKDIRLRGERLTAPINPVMVGDTLKLKELLGWIPANRVREFWAQLRPGLAPAPASS